MTIKPFEHCEVMSKAIELLRGDQVLFQLTKQDLEIGALVRIGKPKLAVRVQASGDHPKRCGGFIYQI